MKILALEASTSSAKAMLYDVENGTFETVTHAYTKDYSRCDEPLQAEETFLEMLLAGREVMDKNDTEHGTPGNCARQIELITLVGVWHSVFLCGTDMVPRSPVFHWSHTGALISVRRSGGMPLQQSSITIHPAAWSTRSIRSSRLK